MGRPPAPPAPGVIPKSMLPVAGKDVHEARFANTIAWLLRAQALLTGIAALIFGVTAGIPQALAALGGGAVGILLTAASALRIGMAAAREPGAMVAAFYRAMAFKLAMAVVLFVIVAKWFAGYFGPVIVGYAATVAAYWLALWRLAKPGAHKGEDG